MRYECMSYDACKRTCAATHYESHPSITSSPGFRTATAVCCTAYHTAKRWAAATYLTPIQVKSEPSTSFDCTAHYTARRMAEAA